MKVPPEKFIIMVKVSYSVFFIVAYLCNNINRIQDLAKSSQRFDSA